MTEWKSRLCLGLFCFLQRCVAWFTVICNPSYCDGNSDRLLRAFYSVFFIRFNVGQSSITDFTYLCKKQDLPPSLSRYSLLFLLLASLFFQAETNAAVTYGARGNSVSGTTSLTVPYPTGIAAGDLLILTVGNKYPTNGPTTPTGWTLFQASGGLGTAGNDSGQVYSTVFVKEAVGTESGNLTVTVTSANTSMARMFRYTKAAGTVWGYAATTGSDNIAGPGRTWNVTGAANPGITAGDVVIVASGLNGNQVTNWTESITATGATFGTVTERQDATSGTGNDMGMIVSEHPVSSGTATAAPDYAMTAANGTITTNSPTGASVFLRIREIPLPTTTIATKSFSADTGTSSTDFITNTAAQTISGTLSAVTVSGEVVEVSLNNGTSWTTASNTIGTNTWSLATTLTASNTLQVRVTNSAGSGTAISQAYVLDTTAPTTTIATKTFSADTGISSTDFITNTAAQTISGTLSAVSVTGEIVEVSINNGSSWTTATNTIGTNTWSRATTLTASDTLKVRVTDTAGNSGTAISQAYVLDQTAPTLAITSNVSALKAGETATITFTFSEDPGATFTWNGTTGDVVVSNGSLGAISGSGTTRTATFTPTANLASGNAGITVAAGTYTDTAGNNGGAGTTPTISIDTLAPTVNSVAITSATGILNSTLNTGDVVSVTVTMSETTTVTGTPRLALNIGGTTVQANYASGSPGTALVFTYTILIGQTDANGISIDLNSLTLNSGTIVDAAGNAATLTHSAVTDNAGYKVDTTAPTASVTTATIINTGNAVVQSTETGTAYLVNNTVTVTNEASITSSGDTNFNSVAIVTANTNTNLAATGLVDGTYKVYTVDAAGNLSAPSSNSVTINSSVSCTSQATGSWSASATWVQPQCHNGGVPIAGDNVTIASGHTVTRSITTPPTLATLTINSGGVLTNNSALTLTGAMSNAGTYSGNGAVTIGGNFTNTGSYSAGSATTILSGNFSNSGTFTAGSGTWTFSGSSALSLTGATSFNNLTLNNAAGLTLNNNVTVSNTLTLTSGILSVGANTLTFNNSIGGVGANTNLSTTSSSNIILSGLGVAIPSSVTTLNDLTINGSATLGSSITLSGTLTLLGTSKLITNSNTLILPNDCSINSVIRTSGYVLGNLKLTFPAGAPTCIYHVGDNTGYSPITVTLAGSAGGTLVGRVDQPDHPDTLTSASGIDWTKSANHYWTLTPGTLASSTSYSATLQFCASSGSCSALEVDTAANTGNFLVALKSSGIWSTQTVGAKTAYTTQVTGLTGFGEFSVGEISNNNCYNDGFTGADGAAPGANWSVGNKNTSATTFGNPKINNNRLRLTDTSNGVATWVTLQKLFPAAGNKVTLEFDHFAYGGGGADGIAVVLSNAATTSQAGAFGGSLGYAQKGESPISDCTTAGGCPGFGGGWLGVGIDEYGNFSATTDGRFGGTGFTQDSVSVRGSGSGMSGYRFLLGTGTLSPGVDGNNGASPPHRYRVIVDHTDSVHAWTSVERDISGGGTAYTALIGCPPGVTTGCTPFDVKDPGYSQDAVPAYWNVSFTGSTGATSNIHEVDTLKICTVQGLASLAFHHLKIEHGRTACTTNAATVTIKACATADCGALYMGSVTANLSTTGGGGTWSPTSPITFSGGQTTVTLTDGTAHTVVLDATATSPTTSNATRCFNGTTETCLLTFSDCTFDAVEVGAAAYTPIYTKLANTSFDLKILSLIATSQTASTVELVDASSGTCDTFTSLQNSTTTVPSTFSANSNKTFSFTYNNAAPNVRVRVISTGPVYSCSSDNFAIRPKTFTLASNATQTGSSGTPVFRAGTDPFTLSATAVYSATTTNNYTGTPKLNLSSGMISSTLAHLGALNSAAFSSASSGVATASPTYSEVGNFSLAQYAVYDDSFALVDSVKGECTSGFSNTLSSSRYSCQFGSDAAGAFGRFVPDHFTAVASVADVCTTGAFTYMGRPVTLSTTNVIEARNAANAVTQNYTPPYAPGTVSFGAENADNGTDLLPRLTFSNVGSWNAGIYRLTSADGTFTRPTAAVADGTWGPFESLDIGLTVNDSDVTTLPQVSSADMNPNVAGGSAFTYKKLTGSPMHMRLGRLSLQNAYGSELLDLPMPLTAQYWDGSSWVLNAADSSSNCTVLNIPTIGNGLALNLANAGLTAAATWNSPLASGNAGLSLSAPGATHTGYVDVTIDSPDWLDFNWDGLDQGGDGDLFDDKPTARATFGIYNTGNTNFIYIRELY